MVEVWKPVVGFEGLYDVSNLGRVRACEKIDGKGQRRKMKMLRPHWVRGQTTAYLRVGLQHRGESQRKYLVHVLVLEAFHGPRPDGMEARHYPDHDTTNNAAANLSWTTRSQNTRDQVVRGTWVNPVQFRSDQ